MPGFQQIEPQQLGRLIGLPDAPMILDVRLAPDIEDCALTIPTARRQGHLDPLPPLDRPVVVVCKAGRKLSEGVAALIRAGGGQAEVLTGGMEGWIEAGLPVTAIAALPAARLWVTRQRPKIDRIACPWLIRRFVDPGARFLYVAAREVEAVAERFGAIPFDVPGVTFSHHGDACSFDRMIDIFGLETPALGRLATVIRAADTDRHTLAPQAAGLLAISVGLSRMYRDDLAQLEAGMGIYDALYRWARDGFGEGHDWTE